MPDLQLVSDPEPTQDVNAFNASIFPACAVTRAAAKRACMNQEQGNQTPNATSATGTSENFSSATPSDDNSRWSHEALPFYEARTIDTATTV